MTKPNFLFIQADQLAARALPVYGNTIAKTPNINALAARGVTFEHAYCNYPLCAPSRFSMISGLLASHAGAYDNGAEYPAALPSFAHYLRLLGYQTSVSGKMHFIGPDQLHGFEERVTTDIYPADFNWTANWSIDDGGEDEGERLLAAAGEVNGVRRSGVFERTIQLDYDDEVAFRARRKIHDLAFSDDERPFCLFVSFTHPHDPFAVTQEYWDRYRHEEIDMPAIPAMPREDLDPHSQRLYDHIGVADAAMTEEDVRVARHAYYGAVSYVDDQVGCLIDALHSTGFAENTVIIFLADHGEALGERGLWFKRSFFDCALQVPLIVAAPEMHEPTRRAENVSLVDLFPTVIDLADPAGGLASVETPYDGRSLGSLLRGEDELATPHVIAELTGEGSEAPAVMVMEGAFKYIHCKTDPPQLYDRATDPHEQHNLAGQDATAEIEDRLAAYVAENWDLKALKQKVIDSQVQRRVVDRAHAMGLTPAWDYDPATPKTIPGATPGSQRYFRALVANPSASNYNDDFDVRARADAERPNIRNFPPVK